MTRTDIQKQLKNIAKRRQTVADPLLIRDYADQIADWLHEADMDTQEKHEEDADIIADIMLKTLENFVYNITINQSNRQQIADLIAGMSEALAYLPCYNPTDKLNNILLKTY